MVKSALNAAQPLRTAMAETCGIAESGTPLATIANAPSCTLDPAEHRRSTWGGARNRADRASLHLSRATVLAMIEAANFSERSGLAFNRHWTVHYQLAGVAEYEGAAFVGRLLAL